MTERDELLASEAEARDEDDWAALATLAKAWRERPDGADHAKGLVDEAMDLAEADGMLSVLAVFLRTELEDEALVRVAAERAESSALTGRQWADAATLFRYGGLPSAAEVWDSDGVRRCLEAGAEAVSDDGERSLIANRFRAWLRDAEAAARVAPRP